MKYCHIIGLSVVPSSLGSITIFSFAFDDCCSSVTDNPIIWQLDFRSIDLLSIFVYFFHFPLDFRFSTLF